MFTIFTPAYNRAYTLPKLYGSLVNQEKQNFEWLIIDDGSTDNTEAVVSEFIEENNFAIRYVKQENQGKHIAINKALKMADREWFAIIDSDDFLVNEATEVWENLALEAADNSFAGFSFIHFSEKFQIDRSKYGKKRLDDRRDYNWELPGEMLFCFKTKVISQYSFPVFPEEKFCQESVLFLPILRKYKMLITDHVLVRGEYLEDGLSQNHYASMLKNPRYGMLSIREKMKSARTEAEKKYLASVYWDIALKSPQIPFLKKLPGIPVKFTLKVFQDKIIKRIF